jgi:uncharacterized protein
MSQQRWLRSLSPKAEFILVVGIGVGYFVVDGLLELFHLDGAPLFVALPIPSLWIYQLPVIGVVAWILAARGWRLVDLGKKPTVAGGLLGVPLAVTAYGAYYVLWILAPPIAMPGTGQRIALDMADVPLQNVVAAALVNSLFEELIVVGYVMTAARKQASVWTAINISVAIRLSYHLYQGIAGVLSILPMSYIFAYWYARQRSLFPLIVAHAILDSIAFAIYYAA